ncbi:hypothetical protein [Rhodoluna sp.]|uniref:hypothetical protein n=1 Tax=Rhodoluna sp. TaxID=1969481 RepID=UPI0025DE0E9B|nr:hypothetical protein [Rhodoluna sp.]
MPRSNRPKRSKKEEPEELDFSTVRFGFRRTEIKRGVEYTTQTTVGANAEDDKVWVCPHCHLQIAKGVSHIVAWDEVRGVETRRHFHNACWKSFQGPLL